MSQPDQSELFDAVRKHVATWPPGRSKSSGLSLLGDGATAHAGRMQQGRRVLVTEHILRSMASPDRPILLMKGLELAQLYPSPVQRPFRDIDLLLPDARLRWDELVGKGFKHHPARRIDIDHHHLPPLTDPSGTIGVEIHTRPNLPRWARISNEFLAQTAQPSRTGIADVLRPRDDLHALLIALHCWKGGFTKKRDLLDALLLASVSEVPVEITASELGLAGFWRWTQRFAKGELLGTSSNTTQLVSRVLMPRRSGVAGRNRSRLLAPYLVASPWRVTIGHVADYRLGRQARRPSASHARD